MAGRKHHFIQKLLLRGFSFDYPRQPCHIWVYRRDGKTYAPATEGYGAERDFYGGPNDTSLDDSITELEASRFNNFIDDLRRGNDRELDSHEAAAFVVHVISRTKNLRSMLTQGISQIMAFARPLLFDDSIRQKVVLSEFRRNPQVIIEKLLEGGTPRDVAFAIQQNIEPYLPSLVAEFTRSQRRTIDTFLEAFLAFNREPNRRRTTQYAQKAFARLIRHSSGRTEGTSLVTTHGFVADSFGRLGCLCGISRRIVQADDGTG